ncbi:hypothetical protein ACFPN2_36225 [Steroidobacter flavus]|uniref:DUF4286 family protein n=1 Tax=Steroidobacter flavus TaxID=1842136 RepID=A0ABV8T3K4_9GAMM
MGRYIFAVQSNPAEGLEQEYNDWYSNQHLNDVLALPGVLGARRLALADQQIMPTPHNFKYFCLYEIELDNLQTFIDALMARAGTERMPINKAMGNSLPVFWKVM